MITEIECTYTTHFCFNISDLKVDWSKVVDWHIKYCTLHYTLDDGTEGNEYLSDSTQLYDNVDTKWPEKILINVDGRWVEKGEEEE